MSKEGGQTDYQQYVGPYRLEKTLGKGQTGNYSLQTLQNDSQTPKNVSVEILHPTYRAIYHL